MMRIHLGLHRAMQATREEEISRAAARQRAQRNLDRSAWAVRLWRAVTAGVAAGSLVRRDRSGVNAYRSAANLPCPDDV